MMFSAALPLSLLFLFLLLIHGGAHTISSESEAGRKTTLGPHCTTNPPTLDPASGAGHVGKLAGFNTYFSGSLQSKHAVLLASDVYGYETPNLRKIADKVAAAGFYAAVPDFFYGEPFNPNNTARPKDAWLKDHSPEKGFKDAKQMVRALKSQGASKVGAAGFCWGAKAVIELAKIADVQAAVILHPSFVTADDIKGVKVPLAVLSGELDGAYPPKLLKEFDDILRTNKIDRFVKMFPKCPHGWTLRYNASDPAAVSRANIAHQDLLKWFTKHLK